MSLEEFVIKWNNDFICDYWWRKKHKVAFNSKRHRKANLADIAFEYMENKISSRAIEEYKEEDFRAERFKKDGWISVSESSGKKVDEAFSKIDLNSL